MFKSKLDFNRFLDATNPLSLSKTKNLAKAGIKKLASKPEATTPFHLALDYFKDDKGNAIGHLINFGTHKKLDKQFSQIELKPGKADKRVTANPKAVSMGTASIQNLQGKATLCLVPDAASKIPPAK